jgi:hypothetical protein
MFFPGNRFSTDEVGNRRDLLRKFWVSEPVRQFSSDCSYCW